MSGLTTIMHALQTCKYMHAAMFCCYLHKRIMTNSVSSQQVQPTQQCDTDQQQDCHIGSVTCDDQTQSVHHVGHKSDVNSKKESETNCS